MAIHRGPNIITDELVFGYDADIKTRFYSGQPTTNLSHLFDAQLNWKKSWNNSGTATFNTNDTSIAGPIGFEDWPVVSVIKDSDGNSHLGVGNAYVNPNTTYTLSVYFWQDRSGAWLPPYVRPQPLNGNQGYLKYNGSTDTSTWPQKEWIRLEQTYTTPATGVTTIYISSYINITGDKIAYCCPQIEESNYATRFVGGTRTGGLLDLSGNMTIPTNALTYGENESLFFNGTSTNINLGNNPPHIPFGTNFTVSAMVKMYENKWMYFLYKGYSQDNSLFLGRHINGKWFFGTHFTDYNYLFWGNDDETALNTWHFLTLTFDKSLTSDNFKCYHNGVLKCTGDWTEDVGTANVELEVSSRSRDWHGEIPIIKIHQKVLSADEIMQDFNAYRGRFGL